MTSSRPTPASVACSPACRPVRCRSGGCTVVQERRLAEQHVGPLGQGDQGVAVAGVGRVGQRAVRRPDPDRVRRDRMVDPREPQPERPQLPAPRASPRPPRTGRAARVRAAGSYAIASRSCVPGRPEQRDPVGRAPAIPYAARRHRGDVEAVVRVQVGQHDRVDLGRVQKPLQRPERPAAEIEQQSEAVLLDQVRRGGDVRAGHAAGAADDREFHADTVAASTAPTSGPTKRRASRSNGSGRRSRRSGAAAPAASSAQQVASR